MAQMDLSLYLLILLPLSVKCDCGGLSVCQWAPWNAWSDCTATCGGGYRERDRPICCDESHDFEQCLAACGLANTASDDQPCGGTCYNGVPSTTWPSSCNCPDAFYGPCCENRIECAALSLTSGTVSGDHYYGDTVTHTCNPGYNLTGGDFTRTCQRGESSSWFSSSPYGYWDGSVPRCAYAVSCNSNPCQNGATCVNGLDMYTCDCGYGWSGTHCEHDILPAVYDQCPENITEFTDAAQEIIEWDEPIFTDPHNQSRVDITAQNYAQPEASLPWGDFVMQYAAVKTSNGMTTECAFSASVYPNPCTALTPPVNGAIACNAWNSRLGEICTIFCNSAYDAPVNIDIEDVYVCGATGNWFPSYDTATACSETRSEMQAESQTEDRQQHYYDGSCDDVNTRNTIGQRYIDILSRHEMSHMCTASRFQEQCTSENVGLVCGGP